VDKGGGGGSFARGPEDYEREALGTDISLHEGSFGATRSGVIFQGF